MKELHFFYCYDKSVMKWLRYEKNIPFACTGRNIGTNKQFWQFVKTSELDKALLELKNVTI